MVAHLKAVTESAHEAAANGRAPLPGSGETYLLVAIHGKREGASVPEVFTSFVAAERLDAVRQHAQWLLQRHAEVERVSVLDAQGGMLLGVAVRSAVGWHAPQYPPLAFH